MRNYIKLFFLLITALALLSCGGGATGGDPLGLDTITVNASATSLDAGQNSVITATVKHANGTVATGRTVSFAIISNNTGGTLNIASMDLDGNGVAVVTYTAGGNSPASSLQDTIQASISNGGSGAVIITRSATGGGIVGTTQVALLSASSPTLVAGQSSIISAKVTDGAGKPISGETVTFSIPIKNSGVPLLSASSGVTDGSGTAITIYSPGSASPTSAVEDTIQASLANLSTRAVAVTRSGNPAVLSTTISTLNASQTTVTASQSSIITVSVSDSAGNPVSGQTVSFSVVVKGSGAPALSSASSVTDGRGTALTIYSPGAASPTSAVEDTIQAGLANGSIRAVAITRSGSAVAPTVIATLSALTASQATVTVNRSSIITANVSDSSGNPVSGQTVIFSIPIKGSGAPVLSAASSVTDGRGNAITIYSPGSAFPTSAVEDTIQASLANGSTSAVTITRSGGAALLANVISTFNASQTTVTPSQYSIVTANITDNAGNPVSGETVTFSIPIKNSGAPVLNITSGVTDGKGTVSAIYTPGVALATSTVEDAVQASLSNGSTRVLIISRSGGTAVSGSSLSQLNAVPTVLNSGQSSIVTAIVSNAAGNPVSGETITFSLPVQNTGSPSLVPAAGTPLTTDGEGKAVAIYSPGAGSPTDSVDDAVQATISNGSSRAVIITKTKQTATANTVSLSSACGVDTNITLPLNSCVITASVKNALGNPVSGVAVTFSLAASGTGFPTLLSLAGTTDGSGNVNTVYTAGAIGARTDVIQAVIAGGDAAVVISD